jgi:hypothetical protein
VPQRHHALRGELDAVRANRQLRGCIYCMSQPLITNGNEIAVAMSLGGNAAAKNRGSYVTLPCFDVCVLVSAKKLLQASPKFRWTETTSSAMLGGHAAFGGEPEVSAAVRAAPLASAQAMSVRLVVARQPRVNSGGAAARTRNGSRRAMGAFGRHGCRMPCQEVWVTRAGSRLALVQQQTRRAPSARRYVSN